MTGCCDSQVRPGYTEGQSNRGPIHSVDNMRPHMTFLGRRLRHTDRDAPWLALAVVALTMCLACSGSTAPKYAFIGDWQGANFYIINIRQSGGAIAGIAEFSPPQTGISTGPPLPSYNVPARGQVSGTELRMQIDAFGDTAASTWTGHFRDATTVVGAWNVNGQSHPDALFKVF
jgi:hypothetical protein